MDHACSLIASLSQRVLAELEAGVWTETALQLLEALVVIFDRQMDAAGPTRRSFRVVSFLSCCLQDPEGALRRLEINPEMAGLKASILRGSKSGHHGPNLCRSRKSAVLWLNPLKSSGALLAPFWSPFGVLFGLLWPSEPKGTAPRRHHNMFR